MAILLSPTPSMDFTVQSTTHEENYMSTLTTPPLSTLLARLFVEADATDTPLLQMLQKLTPEERAAKIANSPLPTAANLAPMKNFYLAVSRDTATLCYMLA